MSSLILLILLLPVSQRSFNPREVINKFHNYISKCAFFIGVTLSLARSTSLKLLGDFEEGWSQYWRSRKFTGNGDLVSC